MVGCPRTAKESHGGAKILHSYIVSGFGARRSPDPARNAGAGERESRVRQCTFIFLLVSVSGKVSQMLVYRMFVDALYTWTHRV